MVWTKNFCKLASRSDDLNQNPFGGSEEAAGTNQHAEA